MNTLRGACCVGLVCLFSGPLPLCAQEPAAGPQQAHLTLKETAQKVVLTNPEVLAKYHAFRAAIGDVAVAEAGYYPKLDYSSGIGREQIKIRGVADNNYTRSDHTLTLSQVLYDGYATGNDIKRVDKTRLVRYFELVDAAENAALEGARVYFDVMRFRMMVFLAENNFIEHRASYEQLLRRSQAGAGKRVDVEHAAGRLALAELNLNTEAANLHDVMSRYLRLVGEAPPAVMFTPGRLYIGFPTDEADALELAMKHNPTLRLAMENVEAAQYELQARRGTLHPRVEFRMSSENSINLEGAIGHRQDNKVGVLLNFNLFNGGADTARLGVSVERKNLALDLREKACRDMRQTLSIAYNDVSRLRAQLANLELQVNAVEKTRDAYKAQFNIGQRSLLDLLDTEGELLNARRTSVNADMDLSLAYLRTHAGIGRLLEFLNLKRLGTEETPADSEFAQVAETDICPPDSPKSYLVNIEALTARALATLETPKPADGVSIGNGEVQLAAPAATPVAAATTPTVGNTQKSASPTKTKEMPKTKSPVGADNPPSNDAKVVPSTATLPAESISDVITQRLGAWAGAWAAKDVAGYTAFYSPTFSAEGGLSRDTWAENRAQRIAGAGTISLELKKIHVKQESPDTVTTRFTQHYRADKYSERSNKTLIWKNIAGKWLIEREQPGKKFAVLLNAGRAKE